MRKARRVLTLNERILVLKMYKNIPKYSHLAELFNCSVTAIRNTVANSNEIMECYVKQKCTKTNKETLEADLTPQVENEVLKTNRSIVQDKNVTLLEECVFETLKRKQQKISKELILFIALEFKDILDLKHLKVDKHWLNKFKYDYNITLSNQETLPKIITSDCVNLQDIAAYCSDKLGVKYEKKPHQQSSHFHSHTELYSELYSTLANSNEITECYVKQKFTKTNKEVSKADLTQQVKKVALKKSRLHTELYTELSDLSTDCNVPNFVKLSSYKDAMLALKPIEEYAMVKSNYKALTLVARLEKHLYKHNSTAE